MKNISSLRPAKTNAWSRCFSKKHLLSLLLLITLLGTSYAGETAWTAMKAKGDISVGTKIQLSDLLKAEEVNSTDYTAGRYVSVALQYSRDLHTDMLDANREWTYRVEYKVYDPNDPGTAYVGNLVVDFGETEADNANFHEIDLHYLDVYEVVLEVTNIAATFNGNIEAAPYTNLPADIYLELNLHTTRFTELSATENSAVPTLVFDKVSTNGSAMETRLAWSFVPGAEEYEIEWIFIHKDDVPNNVWTTAPLAFANVPATRIRTPFNHYLMDMVFPEGKLWFRARAIGRYRTDPSSFDHIKYGPWGYLNSSHIINTSNEIFEVDKNWAYSAVFAEDGKHKSTISYLDGGLKSRQAQTNLSTDNNVIVAESKFDSEGRPTVNFLPVPVGINAVNPGTALGYKPNFNSFSANTAFEKQHFENGVLNPASTISGASQYYSSANTFTNDPFRNRIPDAGGYPYSQVEYTRDNTGRVVQASGIGAEFNLGSSHTSTNYYATPSSTELHRLFGSNVGRASHYKKVVRKDPNGQASVVYTDQEGRTIASALLGEAPSSMDALNNNTAFQIVVNLDENNVRDTKEGTLTSEYKFPVIDINPPQVYSFKYDVAGLYKSLTLTDPLDPQTTTSICLECDYDLTITLTDPNGELVPLDISEGTSTLNNQLTYTKYIEALGSPSACPGTFNFPSTGDLLINPVNSLGIEGVYTLTKELKVSDEDLDAFIASSLDAIGLGTTYLNTLITNYQAQAVIDNNFCEANANDICTEWLTANEPTWATMSQADKDLAIEECMESYFTDNTDAHANNCEIIKNEMLTDVSPGGFHFEETLGTGFWDVINTYWLTNSISLKLNHDPLLNIPNLAYIKSSVGTNNWNPDWPEQLLEAHREYEQYEVTCKNPDPFAYDREMAMIYDDPATNALEDPDSEWKEAIKRGFLDPFGVGQTTLEAVNGDYKFDVPSGYSFSSYQDPYTVGNSAWKTELFDVDNGLTLWEYCQDITTVPPDLATAGVTLDQLKWRVFRGFYMAAKRQEVYKNCTFYTDGIFKQHNLPSTQNDLDNLIAAHLNDLSSSCSTNCENQTDIIIDHMISFCGLPLNTDANVIAALRSELNTFCGTHCGVGNPFGILETSLVPTLATAILADTTISNDWTITQLDLEACLNDVAVSDPYQSNRNCTSSSDLTGIHPCVDEAIEFWNTIGFDQYRSAETLSLGYSGNAFTIDPETVGFYPFHHKTLYSIGTQEFLIKSYAMMDVYNAGSGIGQIIWIVDENGNYIDPHTIDKFYDYCTVENNLPTAIDNSPVITNVFLYPQDKGYYTGIKGKVDYDNGSSIVTVDGYVLSPYVTYEIPLVNVVADQSEPDYPVISQSAYLGYSSFPSNFYYTPPTPLAFPCSTIASSLAQWRAEQDYKAIVESYSSLIAQAYYDKCLPEFDNLSAEFTFREYQYTLYYYDQAGNLVQTVPPEGFNPLSVPNDPDFASANPQAFDSYGVYTPVPLTAGYEPNHHMVTQYRYNSLGQIDHNSTPDGGKNYIWYNHKGQVALSQSAVQEAKSPVYKMVNGTFKPCYYYSYSTYDELERPIESGEILATMNLNNNGKTYEEDQAIVSQPNFPQGFVATSVGVNEWGWVEKSQVAQTHYEGEWLPTHASINGQQTHLRHRVSSTTYDEDFDGTPDNYDHATHYSYDPIGNVKNLWQEYPELAEFENEIKTLAYDYDLISGNVNEVRYQKGKPDAFRHRYLYDADNRLTKAQTSEHGILWENEAKYQYNLHGALARTEIGHDKVQGLDNAYTLQGWLKGVNSSTLVAIRDLGLDGISGGADGRQYIGQDAFGFTLAYFQNDFTSIDPTNLPDFFTSAPASLDLGDSSHDLFNGNISRMTTALSDEFESPLDVLSFQYKYDQLNRLRWSKSHVRSHSTLASTNNWTGATIDGSWNVDLQYDKNGNIEQLIRNGNSVTGLQMDYFAYKYNDSPGYMENNKLNLVKDGYGSTSAYTNDLNDQDPTLSYDVTLPATYNYSYDAGGNLIADKYEEIEQINWTASGKVASVIRTTGSTKPDLYFSYDAAGNRILKKVVPRDINGPQVQTQHTNTWYVRDATGNVMATYNSNCTYLDNYVSDAPATGTLTVKEAESGNETGTITIHANGTPISNPIAWQGTAALTALEIETELDNFGAQGGYYITQVSGDDITLSSTSEDGGSINGTEITCISTDGANWDIGEGGTLEGGRSSGFNYNCKLVLNDHHLYGSSRVGIKEQNRLLAQRSYKGDDASGNIGTFLTWDLLNTYPHNWQTPTSSTRQIGHKRYELSNHLGNVLAVVSDRKIGLDGVTLNDGIAEAYTANVLSYTDYYPFGSPMPGRNGNQSDYRYGFNGMELENEVAGNGNSYTAQFWQYDSRVARRWNVDPVVKEHESPYATFGNSPIWLIDPMGSDTTIFSDPAKFDFSNLEGFNPDEKVEFVWDLFWNIKTEVYEYFEGSKFFATGYYEESLHEYVSLDHEGGQLRPPLTSWEKFSNAIHKFDYSRGFNFYTGEYLKIGGNAEIATVDENGYDLGGRRYAPTTGVAPMPGAGAVRATTALQIVPRFRSTKLAIQHYAKHGKGIIMKNRGQFKLSPYGPDMSIFKSYNQYIKAAKNFWGSSPPATVMTKVNQTTGDILRFDQKTGHFGVMSSNGIIRTFFKPEKGLQHFLNAN